MAKREQCPIKGHERTYFAVYDMFACLECNAWLSNFCSCKPGECLFKKPPRDPSMVKEKEEKI